MNLSGQFWPIHLQPKDDELLSSWILRLARGHGLKLQTFCNLTWGPETQIWNRDIDRLADSSFLKVLHQKTGVSTERIWQTTLASMQGILSERINPIGKSRFVLPLGIYHRIRSHRGMQFCPDCLSDGDPYYRRTWRLALVTVCSKHQRLLHDQCPKCSHAVNFHRGEMGCRKRVRSKQPCFCFFCGYDLRKSRIHRIPEDAFQILLHWQRKFEVALVDGWIEFPRRSYIYSHLFFDGLRILASVICSNVKANALRWYLAEHALWEKPMPFLRRMKEFEHEDIIIRSKTLFWVEHLLEEWPQRFINWCTGTMTSSSSFIKEGHHLPFWLHDIIRKHLHIIFSELPLQKPKARSYYDAGISIIQKRRRKLKKPSRSQKNEKIVL